MLNNNKIELDFDGGFSRHIFGFSVEWIARKAHSFMLPSSEVVNVPPYVCVDVNLPFAWFRVNIERPRESK